MREGASDGETYVEGWGVGETFFKGRGQNQLLGLQPTLGQLRRPPGTAHAEQAPKARPGAEWGRRLPRPQALSVKDKKWRGACLRRSGGVS